MRLLLLVLLLLSSGSNSNWIKTLPRQDPIPALSLMPETWSRRSMPLFRGSLEEQPLRDGYSCGAAGTRRKVYGAVMHINRGNPASQEVLVDSWPEFKIVLTRPSREVMCDPRNYYTNLYSVFYHSKDACRTLLENSHVMDWSKAFQINGLQDGLEETVRGIARDREVNVKLYQYLLLLHPDPPAMPENRPDNGLTLAPVSPAHAVLLNDNWSFGGNSWSLNYLDALIRHFPSACLLDPEGNPISWGLSNPLGYLTHGYTLPAHRKQGYISCVVGALAAQLHACGFPVYATVLPENESSWRCLVLLGFQIQPGMHYQLLVTPRPTQAEPASALDLAQGPTPSSGGQQ